jgi:hypothetical protein
MCLKRNQNISKHTKITCATAIVLGLNLNKIKFLIINIRNIEIKINY